MFEFEADAGNYSKQQIQQKSLSWERRGFKQTWAQPERVTSKVQQRYVEQKNLEESDNTWLIVPHRQTYILPYSYLFSGVNADPFGDASSGGTAIDEGTKDYEAKYQISFAVPLWNNMFGSRSELLFGYTQT